MDECLLTTSEYASEHGVSRRTVQRWISDGLLFAVKIGRGLKIPCDEIDPRELGNIPVPPDEPIDDKIIVEPPDDIIIGDPFPEPDDCESAPCGCDTPDGIDVVDPGTYKPSELRPPKSTYDEALSYMSEIPENLNPFIIRRAEDCFYQVVIDY